MQNPASRINPRPNPYVGPRPFQPGERLYGRETETRKLSNLLSAERIVLMYSPSGAGKTSLIQAVLIQRMRERKFFVRPVARVNQVSPALAGVPAFNRYAYSAISSFERAFPAEEQIPEQELASLTLAAYLERRPRPAEFNFELFIIDQFEEILTLDPTDQAAKHEFFTQLGEILSDRKRWALFAMREDFVAALDPYTLAIPNGLSATFRLDLLSVEEAIHALQSPVQEAGVAFDAAEAQVLVDDLRSVQVQRWDGTTESQPGLYVEPVQLQVVGYRLWEVLPADCQAITGEHLKSLGDIGHALGDYYAERVAAIAAETGVAERNIREWFDDHLITPQGFRGQVSMGPEQSEGLDNRAVRLLENSHLVRSEKRSGIFWFELSHDRLIEPIVKNNAAWYAQHLSLLERQARLWDDARRPDSLLFSGKELEEGEAWAAAHPLELQEHETAFLAACRKAREAAQAQARANRRVRILLGIAIVVGLIAALLGILANQSSLESQAVSLAAESKQALAANDQQTAAMLAVQAAGAPFPYTPQAEEALANIIQVFRPNTQFSLMSHGAITANFSPDGNRLVTANFDDSVSIREVGSGRETLTLWGHTTYVDNAVFSPDGAYVVSASADHTARVWDVATGKELVSLIGHAGNVSRATFSPDGTRIVTSSADSSAKVWGATSGKLLLTLKGHNKTVWSAVFSHNGKLIVTAGMDGLAILWDAATGARLQQFQHPGTDALYMAAFSPDDSRLVTAGDDHTAVIWDVATGNALTTLKGHSGRVYAVTFNPAGTRVLTSSIDASTRVWDAATGAQLLKLTVPNRTVAWANYNPDGSRIVATGTDGFVRVWDATSGERLTSFPDISAVVGHKDAVQDIALSPDGKRILSASSDHSLGLWDIATGKEVGEFSGHTAAVNSAAFSPDGSWVVSGSADKTARIWNTATQQEIHSLTAHTDSVDKVAVSPDGTRIATAGADGVAWIWDASNGAALIELKGDPSLKINNVAFSPDGAQVVTSGYDNIIRVWNSQSGEVQFKLEIPITLIDNYFSRFYNLAPQVWDIRVSEDGQRIGAMVKKSYGTQVLIWNIATKQILSSFDVPVQQIGSTFSPQLDWVFIGDGKTVQARDLATGMSLFLANSGAYPWVARASTTEKGGFTFIWYEKDSGELVQGDFSNANAQNLISYKIARQSQLFGAPPLPLADTIDRLCGTCVPNYDQRLQFRLFNLPLWLNQNSEAILDGFFIAGYALLLLIVFRMLGLHSSSFARRNHPAPDLTAGRVRPTRRFLYVCLLGTLPASLALLVIMAVFTWVLNDKDVFLGVNIQIATAILKLPIYLVLVLPLLMWPGAVSGYLTRAASGKRAGLSRWFRGVRAGMVSVAITCGLLMVYILFWAYNAGAYLNTSTPLTPGVALGSAIFFVIVTMITGGLLGGVLNTISSAIYLLVVEPLLARRKSPEASR